MKTPGIVIAGITSGVGKTTISTAIIQGLLKRGKGSTIQNRTRLYRSILSQHDFKTQIKKS